MPEDRDRSHPVGPSCFNEANSHAGARLLADGDDLDLVIAATDQAGVEHALALRFVVERSHTV